MKWVVSRPQSWALCPTLTHICPLFPEVRLSRLMRSTVFQTRKKRKEKETRPSGLGVGREETPGIWLTASPLALCLLLQAEEATRQRSCKPGEQYEYSLFPSQDSVRSQDRQAGTLCPLVPVMLQKSISTVLTDQLPDLLETLVDAFFTPPHSQVLALWLFLILFHRSKNMKSGKSECSYITCLGL